MADTFTTNLNLTKPEPGAAEDTWGISLNSDLDTLDAIFSSSGTQVNLNPNQVNFADNKKAIFGASNDLQIYHDAANGSSYISEAGAGNLYLQGSNLILEDINGGNFLYGTQGGDVKVYHNGSTKLTTTSTGIDVTGTATMDGLTVDGGVFGGGQFSAGTTGNNVFFAEGAAHIFRRGSAGSYAEFGRFDSSGNLLVGKTYTATGNVGQELRAGGYTAFTRSGGNPLELKRLASDGSLLTFHKDSTSVGSIGTLSGTAYVLGSSKGLRLGSAGLIPATTAGANSDATYDLGDPAVRFKDLYLAGNTSVLGRHLTAQGVETSGYGFIGDGDSGMFQEASNQLQFSTANEERMRLDASGSLLVGTTNLTWLSETGHRTFNNGSTTATVTNSTVGSFNRLSTDGEILNFRKDGTTVGSIGTLSSQLYVGTGDTGIFTNSNADAIQPYNTTTGTVRNGLIDLGSSGAKFKDLHLSGTGYFGTSLGIGTTSPAYSLDVQSSATTGIVAMFSNEANQTSEEALIWIAGQNKTNYGVMLGAVPEADTPSVQDHAFIVKTNDSTGTDHTERFRISSDGNVGIGTTSPSAKLDILGSKDSTNLIVSAALNTVGGGSLADYNEILFDNTQVSGASGQAYIRHFANSHNDSESAIAFGTTTTGGTTNEALRIRGNGNVGIGTTSPSSPLSFGKAVYGDPTSENFFRIKFSDVGGVANDVGIGQPDQYSLGFNVNPNGFISFNRGSSGEAARIDSSGNLLVDKTAIGLNTVGFEVRPNGIMASTRDGGSSAYFNRKTSDGSVVEFQKNGTTVGSIGTVSNRLHIGSGNTFVTFYDTGNSIYPAQSNGTLRDNAIDIGTSSGRFKDLYLSGGLRGNTTFKNNAGTTEYARFDSSGNLLVGTTDTDPSNNGAGGDAGHAFSSTGYISSARSGGTVALFNRMDSDGDIAAFRKDGSVVGTIGSKDGDVYIGTGDTALAFYNAGSFILPYNTSTSGYYDNALTLGNANYRFKDLYLSGAANVGSVLATGNVTAYSDERLKDNIQTLQGSKVLEMRGVSYTKDGEASSGVIAQEIEKVAPELVHTAKDEMGTKSVAYGNLVGYLIEAIKEQQQQIDELKARLDNDSSK